MLFHYVVQFCGISKWVVQIPSIFCRVIGFERYRHSLMGYTFFIAREFIFDPVKWPRSQMDEDVLKIWNRFKAMRSLLDPKYKLAILASREVSAMTASLGPNTHVIRFLERHDILYHYLPTRRDNKSEDEILDLVKDTDFLVLARDRQIISGSFLRSYGKDIINIHHGLPPSFRGGHPSKQAVKSGVKLIGATTHFVTEELDAGPITEQMVEAVSHHAACKVLCRSWRTSRNNAFGKRLSRIVSCEMNKTVVF